MPRRAVPAWCTLARAQHGVISRRQLLDAGLSQSQLATQVQNGMLLRQVDGVYRLSGAVASFDSALWIAVLATQGVLRSTTAAYLWQLVEEHSGPIRIAVDRYARIARVPGVEIFRRDLDTGSRSIRYGLPVVVRSQAILDHAVTLPLGRATATIDRALQQGWLTPTDLAVRLARPRRGNPVLRRIAGGLLAPGNRGGRLRLPLQGRRLQHDRTRQNLLMLLGWTVLRFTWADLTDRPRYVVATIRAALTAGS